MILAVTHARLHTPAQLAEPYGLGAQRVRKENTNNAAAQPGQVQQEPRTLCFGHAAAEAVPKRDPYMRVYTPAQALLHSRGSQAGQSRNQSRGRSAAAAKRGHLFPRLALLPPVGQQPRRALAPAALQVPPPAQTKPHWPVTTSGRYWLP